MWEKDLHNRKKTTQKRGRPKITISDLEEELEIKKEKVLKLGQSLHNLIIRSNDDILDESDLDEYEELLETDDEDDRTSSNAGKDDTKKHRRMHPLIRYVPFHAMI